jgi:hypothetical protein
MAAICDSDDEQVARGLTAPQRYVFLRLANRMNHILGLCYPGFGQLAKDTGYSVSEVSDCIHGLWKAGYIDWQDRWKPSSVERDTNLYTIHYVPHPDDPEKRVMLAPMEMRTGNRVAPERRKKPANPKHKKKVVLVEPVEGIAAGGIGGVYQQVIQGIRHGGIGSTATEDTVYQQMGHGIPPRRWKPGLEPGPNQEANRETTIVGGGGATPPIVEGDLSPLDSVGPEGTGSGDDPVGQGAGETQGIDLSRGRDDEPAGDRVVGGGDDALPQIVEGDALDYSFEGEEPDGMDLSGDPVEQGKGETQGIDISPAQSAGERESAAESGAATGPGRPLEGEYMDDHPAEPAGDASHVRPAGSPLTDAQELVRHFFGLIGKPAALKDRGKRWVGIASAMLADHSLTDLKGIVDYAVGSNFWAPLLLQFEDRDPFAYFQLKLPKLLTQYRGRKRHAQLPKQKSEARHGGKDTTRKTKRQLIAEENRANLEELERERGGFQG